MPFLKSTHTLIGSLISVIVVSIIVLILPEYQSPIFAIVDPLSVSNNRFGIHIISPTTHEASIASSLVNSKGDWGYITVVIEDKDRDLNKWQNFFDDLRTKHLIPIVRLATHPQGNNWAVPAMDLASDWANFLDQLNWPVKNRYVTIYNEPNHGAEWGGMVDPASYAKVLDATITALKNKNQDFFVLNGGLDASTPESEPRYKDQLLFMQIMEQTVPGIFEKLDGWVSHSYPNPGFVGSPNDVGRGTIRTYVWELQKLKDLGVKKDLPVFITETGWKHAEGVVYNPSLPSALKVADYFKSAFENAWNNSRIVAITPFLLNYPQTPFDHFSFTKPDDQKTINQNLGLGREVLGVKYPDESPYYESFLALQEMPKSTGSPVQEIKAKLTKGEVYTSIVTGESYKIHLTFKNIGQSIWGEGEPVRLDSLAGGDELGMVISPISSGKKVKPNEDYTFDIEFKAPLIPANNQNQANIKVILNLFQGSNEFKNGRIEFDTKIKSPVIIQVKSALLWKETAAGAYILSIVGPISETMPLITDDNGVSKPFEARTLLPDYEYDFTLQKPYYKEKTISQKLQSGVNTLDFGVLEPNFISAILNPKELWKLLPWSN